MKDPYDRWGVASTWLDAGGQQHRLGRTTVTRLRNLIGEPDDRPGATVIRHGQRATLSGRLLLEDGSAIDVHGELPASVPTGYHILDAAAGPHDVIVVPQTCVQPSQRTWGWATQLYATRSRRSWGIGDLHDLADLGHIATSDHGAGFAMINPLPAVFPVGEQQASPYSPSTRRFHNPIYLRIEDVPGAHAVAGELATIATQARNLNTSRIINRDAVLALKLAALQRIWDSGHPRRDDSFHRWRQRRTDAHDFATWSTIVEHHGPAWSTWPAELRRPESPALRAFAERHRDRVMFHTWLQWLLELQLNGAASEIGLIVDLPIGFDPDGFDAWTWQDELALGASVGAPPDELNTLGQDWGLPPFIPWRLRAAGYRPFIDTLRAVLRPPHNNRLSGIRIDHVLGLFRSWWVPQGSGPAQGGYVRNNGNDLLGILALESQRSGAIVIGEDLGTVEPGVPEQLAASGVLSYRVLWFEEDTPRAWPTASLGSVSTHDLPTVAGLWTGDDLAEQDALGLKPNHDGMNHMRERLQTAAGLEPAASPDDAIGAAHQLLAQAPSTLLTATLDDAAGEPRRPNIPGATARPNWCLALPIELDDLLQSERTTMIAELLNPAGHVRPRPGQT